MATITREELLRRKAQQDANLAAQKSFRKTKIMSDVKKTLNPTKKVITSEDQRLLREQQAEQEKILKGQQSDTFSGFLSKRSIAESGLSSSDRLKLQREFEKQQAAKGVKTPITTDESTAFKDPLEEQKRISQEKFGTDEFVELSESEKIAQKQTRLERELEQARRKQEIQREQTELRASQRREGIERTTAGFRSAFAQGREGVLANVGMGEGIARGATRQIRELDLELAGIELAAQQAKENIDRYEREGKTELVKAEQDRLNRIRQTESEAQAKMEEASGEARTEALKTVDFISSLSPATIAGMDEAELTSIFTDAGLPSFAATAFLSENQKLSEARAELAKDPNNVEKKNKVLALEGKISQIKQEAASNTAVEKNIKALQGLRNSGVINDVQFQEALNKQIGVESATDKQLKALQLQEKQTKDLQEKAKLQEQMYNLNQLNGVYDQGENPIDKLSMFTSGQSITERYGVGSTEYAGECGAFVNDIAGTPYKYGNSLASKKVHINNQDVFNPQAGSIFISKNGNESIGHVGFVKSVNNDGTVTLADVNRSGKGKYNERNVRLEDLASKEGIIGYENLGASSYTSGVPKEIKEAVDSIFTPGSGISYSDQSKVYAGVKNVAKLDAFNKAYATRKTQLMSSPDTVDKMLGSAGGKAPTDTFRTSAEKTITAIYNISDLSDALNKPLIGKAKIESAVPGEEGKMIDLSPITGWLKSKNPWSDEGALASAALTQTIPNLARGVYGEVGVLTEADVELYRATLPNLTQPEDIRKSVTLLTLKSVKNALDRKFRNAASGGINISGYIPDYKALNAKIDSMALELGVDTTDPKDKYLDSVDSGITDELGSYIDSFNLQ